MGDMMAKGRMVYLDEDKKIGHYRASEELISELAELAKEIGEFPARAKALEESKKK